MCRSKPQSWLVLGESLCMLLLPTAGQQSDIVPGSRNVYVFPLIEGGIHVLETLLYSLS